MWPFRVRLIYNDPNDPYMKKVKFFNRSIHIFYRGDEDPDPHDHPMDFWTFPLVSYVEEVYNPATRARKRHVVRSFRWHFRNAEYSHRVLGRYTGDAEHTGFREPQYGPGKIITYVVNHKSRRAWGFWVNSTWIPWRDYVNGKIKTWMDV
jgi:hypothetical protein